MTKEKFNPIAYCEKRNRAWAESKCDRTMATIERQRGNPFTPTERAAAREKVITELMESDPMNMVRHKLWDAYCEFWEHAKAELGDVTEEEAYAIISEDF